MDIKKSFEELITGAGITFAGVVFAQILTLGSEVLFARILGPSLYGQIGLAASIAVSLSIIVTLGMPQGVARLWRTDESDKSRKSLLLSSYVFVGATGAVTAFIFIAFPTQIANQINSPYLSDVLPIFSIYIVFFSLSLTTLGGLRGMKEPALSTMAQDVLPKASGLIVFGAFTIIGRPYWGAILFWVTAGVLSFVLSLSFMWVKTHWHPKSVLNAGFSKLSKLWTFSWPLAIESAFTNLMTNLDIILIGYFLSSSSIGFYRSVQPLSRGLTLFLGAFTFLYLPIATDYFESGNHAEMDRIYKASTKWILLVTYPLALLFVFFSPEVILTLFDERYLPASTALSVLAIGMFLRAVVGPNGATIKAINQTKIDLLASIVGLVTNLLLNIYLIPKFGFVGAAIATSFSFLAFNLVDSLVVYLTIGVHPFSIQVFKQLVPSGIGAWYLSTTDYISPGLGNLILLGVILSVFHLLSYFLTGSLDRDDVIIIESIENKTGIDMSYLK